MSRDDGDDREVQSRTDAELNELGERLSRLLPKPSNELTVREMLQVLDAKIIGGVRLVERPVEAMGRRLAYAVPDKGIIYARAEFISGVASDLPDFRFHAMHEVGHIVAHNGEAKMARMIDGNIKHAAIQEDRSAEHQASKIARAALMPVEMVLRSRAQQDLASYARVPLVQANLRWKYIRTLPAHKSVPVEVEKFLANKPIGNSDRTHQRLQRGEQERKAAWRLLEVVDGECPDRVRLANGYRVEWDKYLKVDQCSWKLVDGRVRSYLDDVTR